MNDPRPTLLVVDDEPEVLRSVHDLLRHRLPGRDLRSGRRGPRVPRGDRDVHVVMSDQRMPGMTGVEVLHHAKADPPRGHPAPLHRLRRHQGRHRRDQPGDVFRYITKPWEPDELEAVVRQAVEQHDLIVENATG